MSIKLGVAATYGSHLYVAAVGLAVTPLYLRYLGTEAYGLVGFFAMLLAWFQLLDVGLSPAVLRETARFRSQPSIASEAAKLRRIVRAVELLFGAIALSATLGTALLADIIATRWLQPHELSLSSVTQAVWLMAGSIGLRFGAIFYRAVINGFEHLAWLGGFNATVATLRAFAVLPAMALLGGTPQVFFSVQLVIGLIELLCLAQHAYRCCLPSVSPGPGWSIRPLRSVARFSAAVAFTGALTVTLTQADRLILSGLLPLEEYAHFNLAVLAASAVSLAGSPLATALLPRLSSLTATGQQDELRRIYTLATQAMSLTTLPLAIALAANAETVLWAWTGSNDVARAGAAVLALYALGNATMAHLFLPYALQFASGQLRLHVIGNALLVVTLVPGQTLLTFHFGAVGAGAFWLAVNLAYAVCWIPIALRTVAPGTLRPWYEDISRAVAVCTATAALLWPLQAVAVAGGRVLGALYVAAVVALSTGATLGTSAQLRSAASHWLRRARPAGLPT